MLLSSNISKYTNHYSILRNLSIDDLHSTACHISDERQPPDLSPTFTSIPSIITDATDGYGCSNLVDRNVLQPESLPTNRLVKWNKMEVGGNLNLSLKMGDGDNKGRSRFGSKCQPLGTLPYTVSNRDTLTSLAIQFETTPCELRSLNRLMSQMIFAGQEIFIPDPNYVPPEVPPVSSTKPISFEQPPEVVSPISEMRVGSPDKCALKPPGHAKRIMKALTPDLERRSQRRTKRVVEPEEEDDDPSLDMECLERFIKVKVKHITDGQGVVNGVLLVTPNAIMFDPDVSDKLILEKGADSYGMVAPMDTIISAAMYHDIAAMTIKGQHHNTSESDNVEHAMTCLSKGVYHATGCDKRNSILENLNEKEKESTECSCDVSTDKKQDAEQTNLIDFEQQTPNPSAELLSSSILNIECAESSDGEENEEPLSDSIEIINCDQILKESILIDNNEEEANIDTFADKMAKDLVKTARDTVPSTAMPSSSEFRVCVDCDENIGETIVDKQGNIAVKLTDDGGLSSESATELIEDHFTEVSERKRASSDSKDQSIFKRTLKSLPSLGSSFHSPTLGSIISPLSGKFFTSSDEEVHSPGFLSQNSGTSGYKSPLSRSRAGSQKRVSPSRMLNSVTGSIRDASIDVWNAVTPSDKLDLFRSIDEIVPKPAPLFMNPPLYLCLKIGQPTDNVRVSKTCPIATYKSKKHGEYWFSIPREKVDKLYAFFVHWSPNIYDCDDSEAKKRGFVVLSESELMQDDNISIAGEANEDVFDEDNLKTLQKNKLTRQMTKDWEILNVNEMKRRLSEMEEQTVILPELSDQSFILFEKHFRKIMVSLPPRVIDCSWSLMYCTERDGFSLKTVYRKTKDMNGASIIVVQDTSNNLFGAFLSCGIKISDHFYGTGESYLFSFYPEFKKYAWSNKNDFFIKGNVDSLVFGAGEGCYGLWLDGDLYHGRTQYSDTFDNSVLSDNEDFTIKAIEIYSIH